MIGRAFSRSWIFVVATLAATAGCAQLDMNEQPCPCATGWMCCANSDVCVKNGASCPVPQLKQVIIARGQAQPGPIARGNWPMWVNEGDGTVMAWNPDPDQWPPPPDSPITPPVEVSTVAAGKVVKSGPFVANDGDGTISLIENSEANLLATGQLHPRAILADSGYVYWSTYGHGDTQADGTIARMSQGGGDVQVLASGLPGPGPIAIGGTYVYFATVGKTAGANAIMRVPIDGGQTDVLATDQHHPTAIRYAVGELEWTTSADASSTGRFMRMALPAGQPQVVIDDAHNPTVLSWPFYLNDDGINQLVYPAGKSTGSATSQLVIPLDPEPGRDFSDTGSAWGSQLLLAWTNPQQGTVVALLPRL